MAKLKNSGSTARIIQQKAVRSIQSNCKTIVDTYLKNILATQVDANGNRFPEKKESTKKQYRRNGWDTEHWLVRTGAATKVNYRNLPNGFKATPADPSDVLQYVKRAEDWFVLNESIKKQIVEQVKSDLKK